jgi:hypothetical protein
VLEEFRAADGGDGERFGDQAAQMLGAAEHRRARIVDA